MPHPLQMSPWKPLIIRWRSWSVSRSWNWWKVWSVGKSLSSDGTYYGMAMSIRPSESVRPSLFSYMLWRFEFLYVTSFLWTFDQVRVLSMFVNFRQFDFELCPVWNLEYWKYTVFRTFLLLALTYWADIQHMTLCYCTTDQVRVSSIFVTFCRSYDPSGISNTGNTQLFTLFSYILWHIELKLFIWFSLNELQINFECYQFSLILLIFYPFGT